MEIYKSSVGNFSFSLPFFFYIYTYIKHSFKKNIKKPRIISVICFLIDIFRFVSDIVYLT